MFYMSQLGPSAALIPHTVPETLPRDASLSPHKGHFYIPDFTPLQRIFIPWDAGIAIFWVAFYRARDFWLYFIYTLHLVISHMVFYSEKESVSSNNYRQIPCRKGSLWTWPPPHSGKVLDTHKDPEVANGAYWAGWWWGGNPSDSFQKKSWKVPQT